MAEYRSMPSTAGEAFATADEAADLRKRVSDSEPESGGQALDRTADAAKATRDAVVEHPIATLLVLGALGFAVGALWKMSSSRGQSAYDGLLARLSDLQRKVGR